MRDDPTLDTALTIDQLVRATLTKLGLDAHRADDVHACLRKAYGIGYDARLDADGVVTDPTSEPVVVPSVPVKLPGVFCDWFDGTRLALGEDDDDPDCKATRLAYESGTRTDTQFGFYVTVQADACVLRILAEYAGTLYEANKDQSSRSEIRAATSVIQRVAEADATLKKVG